MTKTDRLIPDDLQRSRAQLHNVTWLHIAVVGNKSEIWHGDPPHIVVHNDGLIT